MKATRSLLSLPVLGACLLGAVSVEAGHFKRITIDGSFTDWAGVPPAYVDAEDAPDSWDYKEIYVANDDQFLYLRVQLYAARDYGAFHHQVMIDADANTGTGHPWAGVGSELFVEDGIPWQQKNGGFNEGQGSALEWAVAPGGTVSQYEMRISRNVRDAENLPVFTQDNFALAVQALNLNWVGADTASGDEGTGIPYEFAPTPPTATGTRTLVSMTGTPWRYRDDGTDLGTDWLAMDYDDTQTGWKGGPGLFGFGVTPGTYPDPIQSTLATGATTYYFRVPFKWDFDANGVALVLSTHLSDGAVFYLNGADVRRLRMPEGPVAATTPATGGPAQPGQAEVFSLPPAALVAGNNVLEVEVHQAAATPADLAFGASLVASDTVPPAIEDPTQPADRSVVEGQPTSFSAGTVLGTQPLTYQWLKDGLPIDGATAAVHTIPVVLVTDAGTYSVEISNATGVKITSRAARLTTTALEVSLANPAEPADRTLLEGETTTFTVTPLGSPLFSFQWYKDGDPIDGATAADYTIGLATLADNGSYSVKVSNRVNEVTSRAARLTVLPDRAPPQIAQVAGAATRVTVTLTEPLEGVSANTAAFYTLTGGATVQTATLGPDNRTVTLTTSALTLGAVYTLTVNGVKDLFGNVANASAPFRATIQIDGSFDDWTGVPIAATETQDTPEGNEFKDIYVANDDRYLYVRFSFYAEIGQLPVDWYYHIFADADNDPGTGLFTAGLGSEMMIENGGGYQQKNGGFNEGVIDNLDFALAPEARASEFECRLSLDCVYQTDGQPVFAGPAVGVALQLISSAWAPVDTAPAAGPIPYELAEVPPMNPGPLHVRMSGAMVEVSWTGPGVLEARDSLSGGSWAPVPNATSPYLASPSGTQRYFRLKL